MTRSRIIEGIPPEPAPAVAEGCVLAMRYQVRRLLGQGAMGAVYEAVDLATGTRCAVKTLRPGLARDREVALRFQREILAMRLCRHPNVAALEACGVLGDGGLYLAMELVEGVTLRDVISDGWVAPARALAIVRQVLVALAHAHAHGVVHRDLKPENIMLADGGDPERDNDLVKLVDFGIAKLVGDVEAETKAPRLTGAGIACGTPWYMAPEQARGEPLDGRVDLYAAGVILFELLTGVRPFEHPDHLVVMRMQAEDAPAPALVTAAPAATFTPQLEYLAAEALAKPREERFASAAEMLAALDAARASLDVAVVAIATPPAPTSQRPSAVGRVGRAAGLMVMGGSSLTLLALVVVSIVSAGVGASPGGHAAAQRATPTPPAVAPAATRGGTPANAGAVSPPGDGCRTVTPRSPGGPPPAANRTRTVERKHPARQAKKPAAVKPAAVKPAAVKPPAAKRKPKANAKGYAASSRKKAK